MQIHAQIKNFLRAYIGKSLSLAQEDLLLSPPPPYESAVLSAQAELELSLECFFVAALLYWLAVQLGSTAELEDMPKPFFVEDSKMEQYRFALGYAKQESKHRKKERLRKERLRNRKKKLCVGPFLSFQKAPKWRILPDWKCEGMQFWIDTLPGMYMWDKIEKLRDDIYRIQNQKAELIAFPFTHAQFQQEYRVKTTKVIALLHYNQDLRWRFKRFFTSLRIKRFRKLNDKDPITLDPIKQPIVLHSFPQRITYVFEAQSFTRHIHKQLLSNDGQIPTPIQPRNPFTNNELTTAQLLAVINQSIRYGYTSWAFQAFRMCCFHLETFSILHSKPLRLNAFRTTMAKKEDYDAIDTLYDFIKTQHVEHGLTFHPSLYKWALHNVPNETRIQDWRKLCIQWYETEILTDDPDVKADIFYKIARRTIPLCDSPTDLKQKRIELLKSSEV